MNKRKTISINVQQKYANKLEFIMKNLGVKTKKEYFCMIINRDWEKISDEKELLTDEQCFIKRQIEENNIKLLKEFKKQNKVIDRILHLVIICFKETINVLYILLNLLIKNKFEKEEYQEVLSIVKIDTRKMVKYAAQLSEQEKDIINTHLRTK